MNQVRSSENSTFLSPVVNRGECLKFLLTSYRMGKRDPAKIKFGFRDPVCYNKIIEIYLNNSLRVMYITYIYCKMPLTVVNFLRS